MGTDIDYSTVSHATIYQHLTGGSGALEMMEASRGWQNLAAKLQELRGAVEQAVRGIGAAQQGAAADAATHATMPLLPWLDSSVAAANATAARIAEQAMFFGHARDSMPPPVTVPEVSFSQDPSTWMADHAVEWLPGIQTEHEQAQVAAQQAQQRARELMTAYQSSSNTNLTTSVHFAAAPAVVADVSQPALGGAGAGGVSSAGSTPVHPVHPAATYASSAPTGAAAPAAAALTEPQMATHPAAGGTGAPAVSTPPQLAGSYSVPPGQPMAGSASITAAAAAGFAPTSFQGAAEQRLRGGSRASGGGFGPRPSAWLGEQASQRGSTVPVDAEQAGAGRAARSGAGWAGAPLGAAGSSGRDGDTEHRRPSYLVEQDTNAIIGELPRTVPPVIGADW